MYGGSEFTERAGSWHALPLIAPVDSPAAQAHRELLPHTTAALRRSGRVLHCMLSVYGPRTHIPWHQGYFKGFIRGLVTVRCDDPAKCWLDIEGVGKHHFQPGSILLFDDMFLHQVRNNGDAERVAIYCDIVREDAGRPILNAVTAFLCRQSHRSPLLRIATSRQERPRGTQ